MLIKAIRKALDYFSKARHIKNKEKTQFFEMSSRSPIIYGDRVETFEPYYRDYTTFINF